MSLDPFIGGDDPAVRDVGHLLYRGLMRLDSENYPVPDLASSYTVSPDGLTFSFVLPPDVRWSDGHPLTIYDIAGTVAFLQTSPLADPALTGPWRGVVTGVEPSTRQISFRLPAPRMSFLATVASLPILPVAGLDGFALNDLAHHASKVLATTGPFRVESTDADSLYLQRNSHGPPARLQAVELRLFGGFDKAADALSSHTVDGLLGSTPEQQRRLAEIVGPNRAHSIVSFRFVDLVLNERVLGLDDPGVRHAIERAVDRQTIISKALNGAGMAQSGAIPAGLAWARPPEPPPQRDLKAAAAALDAQGWVLGPNRVRVKGGTPMVYRMTTPDVAPLPAVAREVSAELSALGIAVTVETVPPASFQPYVLSSAKFDMVLADWDNGPDPDVSAFWRSNAVPPEGFNISGGPADLFLDQALDNLATLETPAARRAAAVRVESQIAQDAPAVFLYAPTYRIALSDAIRDASIPAVGDRATRFSSIASWTTVSIATRLVDIGQLLTAALAIVVSLVAVTFTGARLAGWLTPVGRGGLLERMTIALFLDIVQVVVVLLLLGAVHLLYPIAVLVAQVALAVAAMLLIPPAPSSLRDGPVLQRQWIAVLAVGVPFAALSIIHSLTSTTTEFDTRRYHVVNASHWLQEHNTWSLPFAAPGDDTTASEPGDGELMGLWTMLPTHTDNLAYTYNLGFAVLCVLGAGIIARELGGQAWQGSLGALVVVCSPLCFGTQAGSMLTDIAVASGIVVAVALVLRGRRAPPVRGTALLAGLALGLAAGSKYAALLPALAVAGWALLVIRSDWPRTIAALGSGILALAGFWYVRNWVDTGDPIFPIHVGVGPLTIFRGGPDALAPWASPLVTHLVGGHTIVLGNWLQGVGRLYGWVVAALVVLVIPIGGAAWLRRQRDLALVAGLVVVLVLIYLVTPYTGGGSSGDVRYLESALRYSLPAAILASAVTASIRWTIPFALLCAGGLAYDVVQALHPFRPDMQITLQQAILTALLCLGVAAGIAGIRSIVRWRRMTNRRHLALTGAAAFLACASGVSLLLYAVAPQPTTPLTAALAEARRAGGLVVVVHDADVLSVLGPNLDVRIASAGTGKQGQQMWISSGPALTKRIQSMKPAAVVVGVDGIDPLPPGWHPPIGWRQVAELEDDGKVYLP